MSSIPVDSERADPDSLVALVPVLWDETETDVLVEVHPDIWAEPLCDITADESATPVFEVGDTEGAVRLGIDDPIPELVDMIATAKQPFTSSEAVQLEQHSAVWRLTMDDVASDPIGRGHAFARLITTAIEAGAPGVFFPFCLQLHSPRLVKHLAVDFSQPPSLVNLYVNAWNDDDWMITRGLTVLGLPELETPVTSGLNDAYFRLMDVAAGMLVQRDAYPTGARLQLGPHLYTIERGPAGPDDSMVPFCGVYGRLTIARPD